MGFRDIGKKKKKEEGGGSATNLSHCLLLGSNIEKGKKGEKDERDLLPISHANGGRREDCFIRDRDPGESYAPLWRVGFSA